MVRLQCSRKVNLQLFMLRWNELSVIEDAANSYINLNRLVDDWTAGALTRRSHVNIHVMI